MLEKTDMRLRWFLDETRGMSRKLQRKTKNTAFDTEFEQVAAAFASDRQVKRGRMLSSENVLSVNGKIFAMLTKGKFVLKLPKERVDQLVGRGSGENWGPGTRRLMQEWIHVKRGEEDWVSLSKEAYEFVKQGKS